MDGQGYESAEYKTASRNLYGSRKLSVPCPENPPFPTTRFRHSDTQYEGATLYLFDERKCWLDITLSGALSLREQAVPNPYQEGPEDPLFTCDVVSLNGFRLVVRIANLEWSYVRIEESILMSVKGNQAGIQQRTDSTESSISEGSAGQLSEDSIAANCPPLGNWQEGSGSNRSYHRNYLVGYHPHGIISMAAFINFSTNGTGVLEKFPNINFYLYTLVGQFWTPFRREWGLLHGMIDCSRDSINHKLNGTENGNICKVIVGGGAGEGLNAHPGHHILTLQRRKGFGRVALQTGAQLVPCYSFGEYDIYEQADNPKGSTIRAVQTTLKNLLGFSPPAFHRRGVFNYTFGLLPFKNPMNTVLGAPLRVEKTANPSQEQIDDLHTKYVDALRELFEANKTKFGVEPQTQLVIH